jgi:Type VI secretion system effector, Hcp
MTTPSTIANVVWTLCASLFATFAFAMWPLSAEAKSNNTSHVNHHEITVTKKIDKASPVLFKKTGSRKDHGDVKGELTGTKQLPSATTPGKIVLKGARTPSKHSSARAIPKGRRDSGGLEAAG